MGFFSKLWKGLKKPFKAIGKVVKKAFKSFGKFMNKAGILGQVAMFFILPGIANAAFGALGSMWSGVAGKLAGVAGKGVMGSIARGAGWVMQKASQFAGTVKAGFKTVTGAVTEFFGATGRYIGGKLGIGQLPNITAQQAWSQYSDAMVKNFDTFVGKGAEFLGTAASAASAPTAAAAVAGPVTTTTLQDPEALKTVLGETPDFTQPLKPPVGYPGDVNFPAAPPAAPSLLARAGTYIAELPGRAKNYVTSGEMGKDFISKAEAMPGAIATNVATNKLMEMVSPTEEYEERPSWYSNTDTYRSYQTLQPSQVDDYTSFAYQYTSGTSPDGLWGGAVNTKNYYDSYMQQFAA